MIHRQLATVVLSLLLAGCIPVRMDVGHRIDGRIIDKTTDAPIAGAQVMYRRHPSTAVLTDGSGRFTLERQQLKLWLPMLPVDYFGYYSYPLSVRAEGYRSQTYHPAPRHEPESIEFKLLPSR
jgi:hypothetical protein